MTIISLILSICSLLSTLGIFLFLDRKIKNQQIIINDYTIKEKHERQLEKLKANIKVYAKLTGNVKGFIYFENCGLSEARNIQCTILDGVNENFSGATFSSILPEYTESMPYYHYSQDSDELVVEVKWEDDANTDNSKRYKLNMRNK